MASKNGASDSVQMNEWFPCLILTVYFSWPMVLFPLGGTWDQKLYGDTLRGKSMSKFYAIRRFCKVENVIFGSKMCISVQLKIMRAGQLLILTFLIALGANHIFRLQKAWNDRESNFNQIRCMFSIWFTLMNIEHQQIEFFSRIKFFGDSIEGRV